MNRIIVFMQVWNEEHWLPYSYKSIYDFADEIIISEGCHTPWNNKSIITSSDNTVNILQDLLKSDKLKKTHLMTFNDVPADATKTQIEIIIKNLMLMQTNIQSGDWIFIVDADEMYKKSELLKLKKFLKETKYDDLFINEYQFVYNFNTYMDANHHRLFRYYPGSRFAAINHLVYANNQSYRNNSGEIPNDICMMYHYPYMKTPNEIWTKLNSFNRDSHLYPDRIKWFKEVYVPFEMNNREKYYDIVKEITNGYRFAWEGGSILKTFTGKHPTVMKKHPYKNIDWLKNIKELKFEEKT